MHFICGCWNCRVFLSLPPAAEAWSRGKLSLQHRGGAAALQTGNSQRLHGGQSPPSAGRLRDSPEPAPWTGAASLAGRRHRAAVPNSEGCLVYPLVPNFKKKVTVQLTEGTSVTLTQPEWHSPPGVGRQAKVSGKVEVQAACSPRLAPPDPTGTSQSRPHVYLAPASRYKNRAPHVAAD